jgi:hypothetical protein
MARTLFQEVFQIGQLSKIYQLILLRMVVDISGRIELGQESAAVRDVVCDLLNKGHKQILLNLGDIKVGDQILSVNGLNTIEMRQEDLSRQLHGEPGRKIQVTISSGGDQRTLNLTIRNLLCQSPLGVTR